MGFSPQMFSPQMSGPGAEGQKHLANRLQSMQSTMRPSGPGGQYAPRDWVDFYEQFSTPGWQGEFGAGPTALQRLSVGAGLGQMGQMGGLFQDPFASTRPLYGAAQGRAYAPADVLAALGGAGSPVGEQALAGMATGGFRPDIMGLMTAGEDVERRRIGEESAALRAGFGGAGTRRSVGASRAEADLRSRMASEGQAERQRLATTTLAGLMPVEAGAAQALMSGGIQRGLGSADILGGMYGQEGTRQLQAALGLPGAEATAAQTPWNVLGQAYGMGEQQRQISDQQLMREMANFQQNYGALFGPWLGATMGMPVAAGPGIGTQALSALPMLAGAK